MKTWKMRSYLLPAVLLLAVWLLSGCGMMSAKQNMRTTTYPDGRVVEETYSDDAAYYQSAARAEEALTLAADCPGCESDLGRVAMALAIAVGRQEFVARGMNGYELIADMGRNAVALAPYGAIGFVAYEALKQPGVEMTGENGTYAPVEVHQTASDGSGVTVPYRHGSPDTITTEIFEPEVMAP